MATANLSSEYSVPRSMCDSIRLTEPNTRVFNFIAVRTYKTKKLFPSNLVKSILFEVLEDGTKFLRVL